MTKEEALKVILSDIEQAKKAKTDIDTKISKWVSEYEGEPYGAKIKGRSNIVVKDIKKAVEWFLPNAVEPFVATNKIVKLDGITAEDTESAKMHEKLLNYQFARKFDRYNFVYDMFKVGATEGTTVIRTGWNLKEEERVEKFNGIGQDQLAVLMEQEFELEIEELPNGLFNVKATNRIPIVNLPTAEIVRNGNFFPDPSVDSLKEASFAAYRYESTMSDLKASGKYKAEDLEELSNAVDDKESTLEQERIDRLTGYGRSKTYASEAQANKKVMVYEYWGFLDMNGDGIAEPISATLVNDKLLDIDDNPYPDKELPFIVVPFSKIPFSIWGYPIAELISDNQKVRSSLMRGFIDNVAQSNNGKKFIRKGSLDAVNKKKYEHNLGGLIEFNADPEFFDGGFNPIQPSIFNLYELVQQEAESLSGISRTTQGLDSKALNHSATGAAIHQDMSQKRMMDIVRRYAEGLKELFRKWTAYNKEFLSDKEVIRISGEYIPFKRDDISGEFDIDITVGVGGVSEAKVNQMTMLMQQVGGLSEVASIPQGYFNKMLARIADEWGFPDIAKELDEAKMPEPSQEMMEAQALELEKLRVEVEQMKAEAELTKAKSIETMSSANGKNVDNKMKAYGLDKK